MISKTFDLGIQRKLIFWPSSTWIFQFSMWWVLHNFQILMITIFGTKNHEIWGLCVALLIVISVCFASNVLSRSLHNEQTYIVYMIELYNSWYDKVLLFSSCHRLWGNNFSLETKTQLSKRISMQWFLLPFFPILIAFYDA